MMRSKLFTIPLSFILSFCCIIPTVFAAGDAPEKAIYVSPSGSDTASGEKDAPLATLYGAKERVKQIEGSDPVTVYFAEGEYYFDRTAVFDSSARENVTYAAEKGADVVFSGAYPVTGLKTETVNGVTVFTKEIAKGDKLLEAKSLFNNGERLNTPRYPSEGYLEVDSVDNGDALYTEKNTPWDFTLCQISFNAKAGDIPNEIFETGAPTVRILHYWHDEMAFAENYDADIGKVNLSRPSTMLIREGDRYYFENVFSELDEPGEWYLNSDQGKLYYVPQEGETPDSVSLSASFVTKLVSIEGVSGLSFKNIVFECTDWELAVADSGWMAEHSMDSSQAAYDVDGVFTAANAKEIHITGCEFRNLGATAIKFLDGVRYSSVESCVIRDVAATGIFIGGQLVNDDDPSFTGDITVDNNLIYHYGRIFLNAVGVQFTHAGRVGITHNEIHDGYYSAVSGGWTWSYNAAGTRENDISYNLIYNIGQGWLSDMGGIYMLDKQPGTTITHNVIHNVSCDPGQGGYGGWGIYLDEGSSDMLVEKNLVFCCSSQGLNIHYGEGNTFRNNISALNAEGQVSAGLRKEEQHATAFYYNNIFLTDKNAPVYIYMLNTGHFYDNGNLMWDLSDGDNLYFTEGSFDSNRYTLKEAQSLGYLHNVTAADPKFADPGNFDFTLASDSPALDLNFEPWDYSESGTRAGTMVGVSIEGGKTAYNAGAIMLDITKNRGSGFAMIKTLLSIASLLILAQTVFGCVLLYRRNAQMITALPTLFMGAAGAGMYRFFVNWSPVLYVLLLILFAALGALLPALLSEPAGRKTKKILLFIIRAAGLFVLMFAVCLLLNNVLCIGEAAAISGTLCFGALMSFIGMLIGVKRTGAGE